MKISSLKPASDRHISTFLFSYTSLYLTPINSKGDILNSQATTLKVAYFFKLFRAKSCLAVAYKLNQMQLSVKNVEFIELRGFHKYRINLLFRVVYAKKI